MHLKRYRFGRHKDLCQLKLPLKLQSSSISPDYFLDICFYLKQRNITRQATPYVHNCTGTWESTNYTSIIPSDWSYTLKVSFYEYNDKPFIFIHALYISREISLTMRHFLQLCQRVCIYSMITVDCKCYHPYYLDHPDWEGSFLPCNLTADSKSKIIPNNIETNIID